MAGISIKKAAVVAAAGILSGFGLLATTGTAHADSGFTVRIAPVSNPFVFLDVYQGSKGDGAKVIQWSLSGDNQVWTFRPSGSHYQIVNRNSGKCLTSDGVAGHQVYQWVCHTNDDSIHRLQQWDTSLTPSNGLGVPIKNAASGLYMDVAGGSGAQGAPIITYYWTGGTNQYFTGVTAW
jgi:hypothetical protein